MTTMIVNILLLLRCWPMNVLPGRWRRRQTMWLLTNYSELICVDCIRLFFFSLFLLSLLTDILVQIVFITWFMNRDMALTMEMGKRLWEKMRRSMNNIKFFFRPFLHKTQHNEHFFFPLIFSSINKLNFFFNEFHTSGFYVQTSF